ncbi:MAG: hypothetical protein MRY64_03765 [Hyphomonadaceae bacterium]|nr:hypothetical protein [Hyphomonadaceae bacterium]
MSDITSQEIDPKRPWIVDPEDAPAGMNWMQTLTNPFGETSRVHFTRAWTGLFFTRFIYAIGTAILIAIFGAAGAENPNAFVPPQGTWHLLVLVTALASLVMHIRRLTNARRSPLWAILVILPVTLGAVGFFLGMGQAAKQYDTAVKVEEMRRDGMRDMQIARELGLLKAPDASEESADAGTDEGETEGQDGEAPAEEAGQTESGEGHGNGHHGHVNPRDFLPQIDITEISQREHALKGGLGAAQMFWGAPAFFVMLWTLLWVGRLPNGGGTIRERLASEPTEYEEDVVTGH